MIPGKTVTALFLCLLILIGLTACQDTADDTDYVIEWKDAAVEYAVRQELKAEPEEDITFRQLKSLKIACFWPGKIQFNNNSVIFLEPDMSVETIEDLAHFADLRSILLSETDYTDINVIAGFTELQRVILSNNSRLTDISALRGLTKLVTLVIHDNKILRDFSPLADLPGLVELDLHQCGLTDITFLEGKEKLKIVSLHNNRITDLSPLSSATGIYELDLHGNINLSDLSVLSKMENLAKVRLEGNSIADLSALQNLKNLSVLRLDKNNVSDLTPLYGLNTLTKVSLNSNRLTASDIAALRETLSEECEINWVNR